MSNQNLRDKLYNIIYDLCNQLNFELLDLEIKNSNRSTNLEVTIMNPSAHTSFDDCNQLSQALSKVLDSDELNKLLPPNYNLEVQSPGIDRILKNAREYNLFKNCPVEVKLKSKIDEFGDAFKGVISKSEDDYLIVKQIVKSSKKSKEQISVDEVKIEFANLLKVKLSY